MKNTVDSPLCICGGIETSEHFFFECNNYDAIRTTLFNAISSIGNIDLEMLLFGKSNLLYRDNEKIFLEVQNFMNESNTDFLIDHCATIFIHSKNNEVRFKGNRFIFMLYKNVLHEHSFTLSLQFPRLFPSSSCKHHS